MENTSLRGRFSMSSSNLTSPIAESTCLNGTSSHAKFNWGEGTISRNNSLKTNKNAPMTKTPNVLPHKVAMTPKTRIDPRTYLDIHSNGLASRIVKYHDNSTRLNRSLSVGNLYNKPGQFPIVHLKKNEPYKAKKIKNVSMTRIAAPEKSVFYGNTLSSILRSSSIVGLQKSDEEISRENRPILHPPPTENEMAPTRSVLEVLKEISRKRINSDELDGTELTKKQCKEPEFETAAYNAQKSQCKRQREMSTSAATNSQLSPEQQMVKKRICSYNNEITSSLSSSMCSATKKKLLEIHSPKISTLTLNADYVSSNSSKNIESLRNENQSCVRNFDSEHLLQSSKYIPMTHLQSTPQQSAGISDEFGNARNSITSRRASEPAIMIVKPKLTLFNKDYDDLPAIVDNGKPEFKEDGDLCGIQFVKPKKSTSMSTTGSMLLEKMKKSKLALMLSALKGELDDEDEVDSILPKPSNKAVEVTLPVISTTTTSTPLTLPTLSFQTTTATSTTTPSIVTQSLNNLSKTSTTDTAVASSTEKIGLQVNAPATTTTKSSSTSNGFQIISSTAAAITPTEMSSQAKITPAPISETISTGSSIPTLSGFSFGLNKPLSITTTAAFAPTPQIKTITSTPAPTPANPTSIAGIKSFSFGLPTPQASLSTAPTLTFDTMKTAAPTLTSAQTQPVAVFGAPAAVATTATPPSVGQITSFSFGSLVPISKASPATVSSTVPVTSAPTFNLSGMKNTWSPSISQPSATISTNPIISQSSFGAMSTSAPVIQSGTATVTSTTSTGGFQFSGSSSTDPPKTLFGSMISSTTSPQNPNATFSFHTNKAPTTQANQTNSFAFGAPAAAPTAASNSVQTPIFGNTTPIKSANSFTFGATVPETPVKPSFSLPSVDKPVVAPAATGNPAGGFTFNPPATNTLPAPDPNKNIFGKGAPAAAADPGKLVFSLGASTNDQTVNKPSMFGASSIKPTSLFGAPATTTAQSSSFAFGSSSSAVANQGITTTVPSTNLFGGGTTSNQPTNSYSIFGAPSAAVVPLQQSASFTFGTTTTPTITKSNKPAGGFVFGSSSSIGSNASKPATDMNKTFVFGEGSTTITPATDTNLFGGNNTANNTPSGATDNKLFSFGGAGPGSADTNNTFGGNRQTVNQSPVFNFGAAPPTNQAPSQNGNLFAPPPAGATTERPIRKAMRRLHKT